MKKPSNYQAMINELRRYLERIQPERCGSLFTGIHPLTPSQRLDIWRRKNEAMRAKP